MDLNDLETTANSSFKARSVFYCKYNPTFTWDLTETVFPWVLLAIVSIASPIAVILNVLAIIAVRTRKELQRPSNILLSSMAVADILVGAINMPLSVAIDLLISRQVLLDHVCILDLVNINSMHTASGCSLFHLTVIAWERYVAIRKCFEYKVIVTRGRVKKLAIITWFVAVLTTLLYFTLLVHDVDHNNFLSPALGVLAIILIAYFYIMAYREARKRKRSQTSRVNALVKAKLENKVAMTTGLLTSAVILSFVPVIAIILLGEVFPTFHKILYMFRSVETLMQFNSIVNPLLYCYRDRRFRKAVLETLGFSKPHANKANIGVVRSARRKDSFGSLENAVEMENMQSRPSLIRSASCNLDLGVLRFQDVMLKRSISAPSLVLNNSCCNSPKLQKSSTIVITMASIHAERPRVQDKSRTTNPSLSKYVQKNSEGKRNRIGPFSLVENVEEEPTVAKKLRHRLSRSNPCDPAIDHLRCRETVSQRSMSVPSLGSSTSSTNINLRLPLR